MFSFHSRLSRIPQNLPASLKSLQLEENLITTLNQTDFQSLKNLETLNLNGNRLSSLEPELLSPLIRLRTLVLRSNSIEVLYSESFRNLTSLEILDLSQNPLKVIVNGAFSSLLNLNILHLSRLTEKEIQFDVSVFSPLSRVQILDLSDSRYFTKKFISLLGLSGFKSLRELNVERCDLSDPKTLCDQLSELSLVRVVKGAGNSFSNNSQGVVNPWTSSMSALARLCPADSGENRSRPTTSQPESQKVSLTLTTSTSPPTTDIPALDTSSRAQPTPPGGLGQGTGGREKITRNKMVSEGSIAFLLHSGSGPQLHCT